MLGIRIRCNTCGNYMSEGTKFNSREEEIIGQNYLGLKLHRFYIKCTNYSVEMTIRTDPENNDYIAELGATCSHHKHKKEEEKHEGRDVLKSLEERTIVSKKEIEIMSTLDEMKSMKSRRLSIGVDSMLEALSRRRKEEEEEEKENEELIRKSIHFGKRSRIVKDKNHEIFVEKRFKRRDCPKSSIKIFSLCVFPKKTAKLPIGIG